MSMFPPNVFVLSTSEVTIHLRGFGGTGCCRRVSLETFTASQRPHTGTPLGADVGRLVATWPFSLSPWSDEREMRPTEAWAPTLLVQQSS